MNDARKGRRAEPSSTNDKEYSAISKEEPSLTPNMANHDPIKNDEVSSDNLRSETGEDSVPSPEMARVEQRLKRVREYIDVTATLVDGMKNSELELRNRLNTIRSYNRMMTGEDPEKVGDGDDREGSGGERPKVEEEDDDLRELMDTLVNLKDSERKLEDMLSNLASLQRKTNEGDTKNIENEDDEWITKEDLIREADKVLNEINSTEKQSDRPADDTNKAQDDPSSSSKTEIDNDDLGVTTLQEQASTSMNMLHELQRKRQQLESQVEKIQNLSMTTSSLANAISLGHPSNGTEEGLHELSDTADDKSDEDDRKPVNKVDIMKAELEGLKKMLRNVDSIQNSLSQNDDEHQNNEVSSINFPTTDINADILTLQEISQQLKMDAEAIRNEKARLQQAFGKDPNNKVEEGNKSNSKKNTSKTTLIKSLSAEPGPMEKKQLALKAELENKKRELEFLMSKQINHNTNSPSTSNHNKMQNKQSIPSTSSNLNSEPGLICDHLRGEADNGYSSDECDDEPHYTKPNQIEVNTNVSDNRKRFTASFTDHVKDDNFFNSTQSLDGSFVSMCEKRSNNLSHFANSPPSTSGKQYNRDMKVSRSPQNLNFRLQNEQYVNYMPKDNSDDGKKFSKDSPSLNMSRASTSRNAQSKKQKKGNTCLSNNSLNNGSSSSSIEDQTDVPPPMATLPPRRSLIKNGGGDNSQTDNTHCDESQIMWWHDKAVELQKQLELTNNLCQNLLQDRNNAQQVPANNQPAVSNFMLPNLHSPFMFPFNIGNNLMGGNPDMVSTSWFTIVQQQQQLALQQQQLAVVSLGNSQCMQQLLAQQREIFSLRNNITTMEEKLQHLNISAQSAQPNLLMDNYANMPVARANSSLSQHQTNSWNMQNNEPVLVPNQPWMPTPIRSNNKSYGSKPNQNDQFFPNPSYSFNEQMFDVPQNPMINQPGNAFNNIHLPLPQHNMNNAPQPIGMPPINCTTAQTVSTSQSTALNNQVPPGNRANNYWDNFRSYSRQNLLSTNSKANADGGLQSHPHPLVERSHNPLRSSLLTESSQQITNTPKRNLNNTLGNALHTNLSHQNYNISLESSGGAISRTRRNLLQDSENPIQPDVVNLNQHSEVGAEPSSNTMDSFVNINLNRPSTSSDSNLNSAKRKSSSKLPAKNASLSRNYSNQNNCFPTSSHNLASNTAVNADEKSTEKLFDLLKENVYSEVSALITANESRPHFLIQLFRDLQHISSDDLRHRILQSIQELSSHYLMNSDRSRSNLRESSTNDDSTVNRNNERFVNNEINDFIMANHSNVCSLEFLNSLHAIILNMFPNQEISGERVYHILSQYEGRKVSDIDNELIVTIAKICLEAANKKSKTLTITDGHTAERDPNESQPGPSRSEPGCGKEIKVDLIQYIDSYNGDLAEADQSCHGSETTINSVDGMGNFEASLPDVVDTEEQTPTEAEAEWLGLDRIPGHSQTEDNTENQTENGASAD